MRSARPERLRDRLHCRFLGVDGNRSFLGWVAMNQAPVVACVGLNGAGKTAAAVAQCLPFLIGKTWGPCRNTGHVHTHGTGCTFNPVTGNGCVCLLRDVEPSSDYAGDLPIGATTEGSYVVWSTTRLLDPTTGQTSTYYRPLKTLGNLARIEHAVLLLDEVPGIADSRDHMSLPAQVRKAIAEMRRRDTRVIWTCPDFSQADSRLRSITQAVVSCRGLSRRFTEESLWGESRLLRWSTYSRADFDTFTANKEATIRPLGVQYVWRPGHALERAYDTRAPVLALSVATEKGACMVCGGSRPAARCGCPMDDGLEVLPGVLEVEGKRGGRVRVLRDAHHLEAAHDG